jgi:hypothetical protein
MQQYKGKEMDYAYKEMRIIPPSAGLSVNALDVFLEALVLFLAGAMGMLLPLLAMNSGSVSVLQFKVYLHIWRIFR